VSQESHPPPRALQAMLEEGPLLEAAEMMPIRIAAVIWKITSQLHLPPNRGYN